MARLPFPENTITGHYGTMSAYRKKHGLQPHSGTDFAPKGSNKGKTAIPAVANGTVKMIRWSNVLGWVIVQTVWDSQAKKTKYVGYCHLSCGTHGINCKGPKVHGDHAPVKKQVGHKLKEGDIVAYIGNTGSASSGPHLHLTLSNTERGVFGVTKSKQDFVEWVKAQSATPKQTDTKAKKVVEQEPVQKVIYACPHCKKELK